MAEFIITLTIMTVCVWEQIAIGILEEQALCYRRILLCCLYLHLMGMSSALALVD